MKSLVLAIALLLATPILHAQEPEDERPSNAERARPWLSKEYREKEERNERQERYPYLQKVTPTINTEFGLFLNRNMIVETEQNVNPQNESSIAINPVSPNVLLASAVDFRGSYVYISTDGGHTWRDTSFGRVNTNWQSGNDPSVAFDHEGNGYVMYGAFPQGNASGESGVYVAKTTDNGATWTRHVIVIEHKGTMTPDSAFEDKYYIAIDNSPTSPYRGRMYTPWKRVIDRDSSTQIVVTYSTDRGLTWSTPLRVSPRKSGTSLDTTFGQSFPLTTTGPDGTLYVVWNDGPIRSIGFAKSTDGGVSFTAPTYPVQGYPTLGTTRRSSGSVYHVLKNTFRAETYPAMMADNSNSPRRGWLYLAYAAGRNPNIYFIRSTDAGATWSQPRVIHSDTLNDQWWPWLNVDETTGDIAVMYHDSRHDPANILVDTYVSYSRDGGDTWVDRRVTDVQSDFRDNGIFAGDYAGIAFHDGKIYPSFLDMRESDATQVDADVFTALVNVRQPYPVENLVVRGTADDLQRTAVTWTYPSQPVTVFGFPITNYVFEVRRNGQLVGTLPSTTLRFDDQNLNPDSTYRYEVRVVVGSDASIDRLVTYRMADALLPARPTIATVVGYKPTVDLHTRIPGVRADSSTPLGNLKGYRLYRDGVAIRDGDLNPGDTGTAVVINDTPTERGYYRYSVTILDGSNPGRESTPSDTVVVYVGETTPYSEGFDGTPLRFLYGGTWVPTSKLALSAPNSSTDSPDSLYKPRTTSTMLIYPVTADTTDLLFAHIAIVDPGDSAVVEASYDQGQTWSVVARYSLQNDAAWGDRVANPGDWRQARVTLKHPNPGLTAYCVARFRLTTGTLNNAEGWYVDDISFGVPSGVDDPKMPGFAFASRAYPNPAASSAIIAYELPTRAYVTVRVMDLVGREVAVLFQGEQEGGNHAATLDVSGLPVGTYLYEIRAGERRAGGTVVVVH